MIDKRRREYLTPVKILTKGGTVTGEDCLLMEKPSVAVFSNRDVCRLEKNGFVLLDFGREISGCLRITAGYMKGNQEKSALFHVRFGESASEAMSELGDNGACNDHVPRDIEIRVPQLGTVEYGETGFRFVRIDLLEDAEVCIQCVKAVCIHDDVEQKGSFTCDDELLNTIWKTGVYTVKLNMQNYLFDGVKRDRLVWLGDMQPETDTISSAFGYAECVERSLDLGRDIADPPTWINNIPTYSMWWVIIQYDYYLQNGKVEYLLKQKDYIEKLLPHASSWVLHFKDDCEGTKSYVDWSARYSIYEEAGVKAVFVLGFEAAEKICQIYGNDELERLCRETAAALRIENLPYEGNKQIAALTVLAGMNDAEKVYKEVLEGDLLEGLSTFMGYYVLQAMAKAEQYEAALYVIRKYWGAMLDLGATTFWEDFDIRWTENAGRIDELTPEGKHDVHREYGKHCYKQLRHSLCHGWASGPTSFLTRYVMGIKVLEPGCRKVTVEPHLCGLKWVKGDYPTPYGVIHVEHVKEENGEVTTIVEAPKEIEVVRKGK